MKCALDKEGELRLRVGESAVRVYFRRPEPGELIESLVRKIPRGSEEEDSQRALLTNLDLGRSCVTGVGEGDLVLNGESLDTRPESQRYQPEWKRLLEERCPLILIALGQHLSALPSFMEDSSLKKT